MTKQLVQNFMGQRRVWISTSSDSDLVSEHRLKTLVVELCRYIFAADGTIAYGGDLRAGGLTYSFYEAAVRHFPKVADRRQALLHVLPEAGYSNVSTERLQTLERELQYVGKLLLIDSSGAIQNTTTVVRKNLPSVAAKASVDCMRRYLSQECDAMIAVGGKVPVSLDRSGISDEVSRFRATDKPLFMLGGFGGVVPLLSERPMNTGLSTTEQLRLWHSSSMQEVVSLVLRGLRSSFSV